MDALHDMSLDCVSQTWFSECMGSEIHPLLSPIHCVVYRGSPLSFGPPVLQKSETVNKSELSPSKHERFVV